MNKKSQEEIFYNIMRIIRGTTVDGPGFRTSIYLAGCTHKCFGCHNPQSHDPNVGDKMSLKDIMAIVEDEDFDVTLSGGDPLFNPDALIPLLEALKNNRRNIWIYTGFSWEEIVASPYLLNAVRLADTVVDGPFIMDLRDPDLPFRGSSNQRIIDIQSSLSRGVIVTTKV